MHPSAPTPLLRIPDHLASAPNSRLLTVGHFCFGEYQQDVQRQPRNIFVTEHTLIFVTQGAKVFRFADGDLTVSSGQAVFLQRGCYLLCESLKEGGCYESISLFFKDGALREFWAGLRDEYPLAPTAKHASGLLVLDVSPALANFCATLVECFSYQGKYLEQLVHLKLRELVLLLLDTPQADQLAGFLNTIYAESLPDPVFTVSRQLMTPLSLADYARLTGRSLSKFKRDFQAATGRAPGKWIQGRRLDHARMLAQSTKLTVGEICIRSGFNNLSHFIRAYKSAYGHTPSNQRAERRESHTE